MPVSNSTGGAGDPVAVYVRMSRDTQVVRPLWQAGVWVEAGATGRLDWDTVGGSLTDHIQQHQAAAESPTLAYRTLTALLERARGGRGAGGPVPYGYVMTYETAMVKGR